MLRNTLKPFVSDTSILDDEFYNKRPEELSVQDFINITNHIEKYKNDEFRNEDHGRPQRGDEE
jgi:16S rRNA (adenine1518-N6/adenine1519-N6)-dimethyltransferase